jgi:hypothetical protein
MHTTYLSLQLIAVMIPFTLAYMSPHFHRILAKDPSQILGSLASIRGIYILRREGVKDNAGNSYSWLKNVISQSSSPGILP